ncbi:MAG: HDOD domain-containing protein, partial [Fibromonadaceae bacterium]|nr:HDOD domain-containing protein [Fibromonadaceae bacterium]
MPTEYIKRITQSVLNLSTLPTIAAQLLELVDGEKEALEQIVSSDPVLAARLLKMTNSRGEAVTSVHTAISKLGFEQVKDISIETSMSRIFELNNSKVDLQKFWDHCSAVSIVARIVAQEYEPDLAADASTAGLLHDFGKFILLQYQGSEFEKAIDFSKKRSCELYLTERELFGENHGEIGARLADSWRLP